MTKFGSPESFNDMTPSDQQTIKARRLSHLMVVLSPERFGTYLNAAGHDPDRALEFYIWNAKLGEAFHLPIQAVEIGLRNRINLALTNVYGVDWWKSPQLTQVLDQDRRDDIRTVLKRLRNRKLPETTGQIVASLSFGFWVGMLQARYNPPLWGGQLRLAFPYLPRERKRTDLAQAAGRVASLRNRISHHEPLINRDISKDYSQIKTLMLWLCPTKWAWVQPHCRVPEILRAKP